MRALMLDDAAFPAPLRDIVDPPRTLYVLGTLPRSWDGAIAVVGTRTPTRTATDLTAAVVRALARRRGTIVVSGLAPGIDTRAHWTALRCAVPTVAVVANGLDAVYPPSNRRLAQAIVAAGGALVSERPPGAPATRAALVARDRLQSGLARAVFVMQTEIGGGAMHTARFARLQGRALFALEPRSTHRAWGGNADLLAAGAATLSLEL